MLTIKYLISKFIKKIQLSSIKESTIDKTASVGSSSQINNCTIGRYSYIGNNTNINHTKIGNYCSIADRCIIGGGSHPYNWVSTSPVFYAGKNSLKKNYTKRAYNAYKKILIGNDVWIGAGVYIKGGIKIANGSVIGMGSVVTKDVGPYEIWGGNPAKLIKKRFDDESIRTLNNIKWWEWEEELIQRFSEEVNDYKSFIEKVKENENPTLG